MRSNADESGSPARLFSHSFRSNRLAASGLMVTDPNVTSLSPSSATAGGPGFTLHVNGTDFVDGFVIRIDGNDRATTFADSTELTTAIAASDIETAGTFSVTVFDPDPDLGGESAPLTFAINNPAPTTSSLSPSSKIVGEAGFTLTVNGNNFVDGATVDFGGTNHNATVVDATELTAQISASEIDTVGTISVTVTNPTPGGGTSSPRTFTVNNPAPTLSSISPTSKTAGDAAFTLTVTGTNFVSGAIVRFNGSSRTTSFVGNTELTAQITLADVAVGGTFPITVLNPSPGGGTSNAVNLTVNNPSPTLSSINPTTRTAGSGSFTLTVTGTNFNSSSVIRFNGSNRTTTFVSSTSLTAQIASADTATGGTYPITVQNPTPGGGTSTAVNLTVNNPSPSLSSINPTSRTAGTSAFTLTATGTNFNASSVVRFNGSNRTTTFVSSTSLTAQITAADIVIAGTFNITVFNPTPGGGTSSSRTLTVNNPVPTLSSINPTSRTAAGAAFTLTATGTNFNSSSIVRFNGSDRTTTFVSSTQLTAQITAADIATGGSYPITVFNPSPSGGTSSSRTLTVNNPVPTLSSISPSTKTFGDVAFTLTVTGTNFVGSSIVRFNGSNRTTTFVSSTQLTAQITAADIATVGTYPIGVFNPTPSGGQSGTVNLSVNNLPPTISSISPSTLTAGGPSFTLTVDGTLFLSGAVVRLNGANRTTTFVSATQLTALIPATDIINAGTFPITVSNPAPGGGTSSTVNLTVIPSITSLSPATVRAGGPGFTLTVNGAGFVVGAVVRFNGSNRSTTFVSPTTLTASIPATDILSVGTFPISVLNPDGLSSNASNLPVTPSLNNLTPLSTTGGNPGFTLTVQGAGFLNGSVVLWNGSNRPTTFVSSIKLTASISAADVLVPGPIPVTVLNPAPNSLTSNAINFIVTEPPPATECASGADVDLAEPGKIASGPARSQMWYTNDGIWWGAFQNNTDGIYFYKRSNPTTWNKGALIETSMVGGLFVPGAPDCLWTGTNLFVLIQESKTLARLYKYTYASGTQTYSLASGFPVNLALIGVGDDGEGQFFGSIVIEQDSTGKLWVAYAGGGIGGNGNVRVIYSTSADHRTWNTTGFILASGVSTISEEGTAIARFGGNKIGVAWSNTIVGETAFRFHTDGQSDTTWSAKQVIDSGLGPQGLGSAVGKQFTMKGHPDGRLFFVGTDSDGNKHLHLYIRTVAGAWGQKTLVVNNFNAMPGKPVLLLDIENSIVHVVYKDGAVTGNGLMGQTFITQTFMTNPVFNTACLIIDSPEDDTTLSTSNPTSTKQTLNATTDLVVAGSTGRRGNRILSNMVDLTPNVLTIFHILPEEITAGESASALNLTVNGKLFAPGAVVRFNGSDRTTTFFSAGKLTTTLLAADTATAGMYPITVMNPGGAVSNAVNLVVTETNPVPNVGLVSPNREAVGHPQFTMSVHGSGFRRTSVVRFNGNDRTTTYVSDVELTATIPASDLLVPGPYPITVFNPTPGGGTSTVKPVTTFYVQPSCSTSSGQNFPGITLFNTVKSQMWYNDSLWWGAFSDNLSGVFFYKQNGASYIQGALIESNFNGRPDVLWNGTHLFVLVYEFNTLAKLYKYSYNTITDTYTLLSGFPVSLPLTGIGSGVSAAETGSITLAQDSTGKLWAAYPGSFIGGDGNYRVIWTTSADHKTWNTTGHIFATGGSVDTQEVAPIVHFGGNKIGIVYSHQPSQEIAFLYHNDGDPETTWGAKEVVDSGLGHLGIGGVADNHMSVKAAPDGRIFLVAKDSDGPGFINLYVRSAAGVWSDPALIDIDPHSAVTRPTLLLDLENSEAYALYADATSSFMYINKTSMNNPVFGPACPYVSEPGVSDGTSTKQNLKASMGLRAAGSTGGVASTIFIRPITLIAGSGNVPVLSSVSPSTVGADKGPFTLTVNGSNFASSAVVYFNGSDRATTFVSSTQLTARLMATDTQALGTYPITVMNPKGGTSSSVNFTVNPAPTLSSLTPSTAIAGGAAFTLTASGAGFINGAVVRFNGVNRTTTILSATQLSAQILAIDIESGGNKSVTAVNPDGGTSAPSNFTVNNPLPTGTTLSPASVVVGGGAFTLTVNGSNFNSSSVVNFNGVARTTSKVNNTQLTAQIQAADIAATGTFPITVFNPAPVGGTSNTINLSVVNPVPVIAALSPPSAIAGAGGFTLSVNGSNFNSSSIVRFNGSNRTTTFVNATQLTAGITAADVQMVGTFPITVFNSAPGGGASAPANLSVNNPAPALSAVNPTSKTAGAAAFALTANGSNFISGSIVRFNGSGRATTFVNATQLTAQITAADVAGAGTFAITVFNPAPGGGTSNATDLTVNNPAPTTSSISPLTKTAGGAAFTLTVNGSNYNSSSIVRFNGSDRTTAFVSSTQLTAQITAVDVAAAGTFAITVFNPAPGGGTSSATNLTVNNPAPTVSSISPTSRTAGDAAFMLTVNGTNLNGSSIVRFNSSNRATTFVNTTQLTVQITAVDVAAAGTFSITIFNPAPGGGTSNASTLTVNNPAPTLGSISPSSRTAGDGALTLTVDGTNFVSSSVVRFNGSDRATTFVSSTQLTAQITAADVQTVGTFSITVFNPAPGGGTSNASTLTVNNPAPTLGSISPSSKTAGDGAFTLTVDGTNFVNISVVRFNGSDRATTFVSGTQLTAQITAADLQTAGTFSITVFNPAPGGGTSNASTLTVNNPAPTLGSISPLSKTAGDTAFTLTVEGTNFVNSSVVRFNGSDRATTFVSSTQLTAQITAADLQTAGTFSITVFNPAPGGNTSNVSTLTVNNPVPTLSSISSVSKTVGDIAFTLTVGGTNFVNSSVVRFNGSDCTTTFVSSTQLTAQFNAADLQAAGTFPLTVFSPAPGGGTSNAVDFTVNNPVPAVATLAPNAIVEGSIGLTLSVNGTAFASGSVVHWNGQSRTTSFVSPSQLTAQITAADVASVGTADVTVFNPAPGGGTSNVVIFSIDPNTRVVQVVNSSGSANSTVTVPIQLASQGDENVLSFSLNFDTTLLSNPQATVGNDAAEATLNTDSTQVVQGHYGIALSLPGGQSFAAGTRHIVNVTFTTAVVATPTVSQITFGDQPTARQTLSSSADTLPVIFTAGTATITLGYEADVAPRPNGSNNGTVSLADWVQVGRFSAGLDIPDPGSEFQRADCSPKDTLGNGSISISDYVQAGRYASGLDPVVAAGGPTGAASAPQMQAEMQTGRVTTDRAKGDESEIAKSTKVDLVSTILPAGQNSAVSIEFDGQGNENAFGFSLMFDPAKLRFVSAEKSSEASAATLNINKLEATNGRLGIVLALPAGSSFAVGRHQLVVLNFTVVGETSQLPLIGFTDQPISREVVDLNANRMPAVFQDALGVNPIDDAQFFVQQHYLNFLSRTADSGGLDYWTQQISQCGSDLTCVGQRRIAVSTAFFMEQEFQQTGGAVYRLYRAAYGRRPTYAEFLSDRSRLIAGEQLPASKREFAHQFVAGGEFKTAYPDSLSAVAFVNKLYESAGLSQYVSEKQQALEEMRSKGKSRAQVLLELIENKALKEREYNAAFVLMQYFGSLRRDPDQGGYDFWLNVLNHEEPGNYPGIVCSFITSREYQERFSKVATRTTRTPGLEGLD